MIQKQSFIGLLSLLSIATLIVARPHREEKINLRTHKTLSHVKSLENEQNDRNVCRNKSSRNSSSSDSDTDCVVCGRVTPIFSVPFTITESGKYCLTKNVTYNGSNAAIVVAADNVSLNLANHSITLTSPSTAILISNVQEVTILNDALQYQSSTGAAGGLGIYVSNAQKVTLDNNLFSLLEIGVLIENSLEVELANCAFNECEFGSYSSTSTAIKHENTTFDNCGEGLTFDQNCKNIFINNVIETNSLFGSYIRWAHGVTIQNSTFECINANNPFSLLQLGSSIDSSAQVFDIIIQNCQFINRMPVRATDPGAGFEGILFAAGSNAIFDSCVVDINSAPSSANPQTGQLAYINGALHFGQTLPVSSVPATSTQFFTNVNVSNCIISNLAGNAITTENSTQGLNFERNSINSSLTGIYLQGTTNTTIKYNNIINNITNGITLTSSNYILPEVGSIQNTVEQNIIADNNIIGVEIASGSDNNLIYNNQIYGNGVLGLDNNGLFSRVFSNNAFNNGNNYSGIGLISSPGAPTIEGANISA